MYTTEQKTLRNSNDFYLMINLYYLQLNDESKLTRKTF